MTVIIIIVFATDKWRLDHKLGSSSDDTDYDNAQLITIYPEKLKTDS